MDWGTILTVGLPIIMLILEYWLGKTDKTKSSSTLELVENILKGLLGLFKK